MGTATFFIALLAFLIGLQVGVSRAPEPATAEAPPSILPDADDEDALEQLLREVEYARTSASQDAQGGSKRQDLSFPDALRGDAEDAAALGSAAPPPEVVTSVPAPDGDGPAPPEALPTEQPAAGWVVQVAAYQAPGDAAAKVAELTSEGLKAYSVPALINGETWYRVRIGGFERREDAVSARATLAERLGNPDLLIAEAP